MKKKHLFAMILAFVLVVIAIISTTFIIKSNIFNPIYLYTGLALMWVLILFGCFATFHNDKKIALVGKITVIVMISGMLMLTNLFYGLNDSLNNFKYHKDLIIYSLYAKDKTSIKNIGLLELGNQKHLTEVKEIIDSEYPNAKLNAYNSINDINNALKFNDIDTLVCLDTYKFIINEYDEQFDLDKELTLVNRLKFEDAREKRSDASKDTYVLYLSTNNSEYDTSELRFSTINKLVIVNTKKANINVINIPYNYYLGQTCLNDKKDIIANANIYGLDCAIASLEKHFDTQIDYYLKINLDKLIDILDKLGGIDVKNSNTITTDSFVFKNGILHLQGNNILEFLAYKDENTYHRENEVLNATLKKIHSLGVMRYVKEIDDVLETNLCNDMIRDLLNNHFKINYTNLGVSKAFDFMPSMGITGNVYFTKEDALKSAQKLIKSNLE